MVCIYCGSKTVVSNSRPKSRTNEVWRRRVCNDCHGIFTSVESIDFNSSLLVQKQSDAIEPFRRDKLFLSVYDSLKHRNNATEAATALTNTIIGRLLPRIENAQLKRVDIQQVSTEVLKRFDKVASVHYQAYHPL